MTLHPPSAASPSPASPRAATHLLYLHGFRSSPQSMKARKVADRVAQCHPAVTLWCPQLPPSPREAMAMVLEGTADWPEGCAAVIGSSLGGFYASAFAAERQCRAALVNPAVRPDRDLERYIGNQSQWHDPSQSFYFQPQFIGELQTIRERTLALEAQASTPTFALIAKGDEVLDWREAVDRYPRATLRLIEGSDHAVSDFDTYIDEVLGFLRLGNSP